MSENAPTESILFSGRIGEIVATEQQDGRVFERYRRPPGTRLVIVSPDGKILMTKEYRHELSNYDLRLPGGKVRDTIESYHGLLGSGEDLLSAAKDAASKEALEETGLLIREPELITIANAGATVEWDLYYFKVTQYEPNPAGQQLEHGEDIEIVWLSAEQIIEAIRAGSMQEWRSVGVLLGLILPELHA